jgi:hypothetical protein
MPSTSERAEGGDRRNPKPKKIVKGPRIGESYYARGGGGRSSDRQQPPASAGAQAAAAGESTMAQSEKTGDENRTAPSLSAVTWRGEREAQAGEGPA